MAQEEDICLSTSQEEGPPKKPDCQHLHLELAVSRTIQMSVVSTTLRLCYFINPFILALFAMGLCLGAQKGCQ